MLLKIFVPFFIFSLPTWVFANPCEEAFSSSTIKNDVNEVRIQQVSQIIERYIGRAGALYEMRDVSYRGDRFYNVDPREMREVMNFIDYYTKKHGVVEDTLDNRVEFFKRFISLPREQRKVSKIKFSNLSELKEFSELIFETLKEKEREITARRGTTALEGMGKDEVYSLEAMILVRVRELLFVYQGLQLGDLKKTIRIFEKYITPAAVAYILLNEPNIFKVNPEHLKEGLNILERAYGVSLSLQKEIDKVLSVVRDYVATQQDGELTLRKEFIKNLSKTPKELVGHIIETNTRRLLSINPAHLKDTISILENYIGKVGVALILRMGFGGPVGLDLISTNSNYLQKIINVLEKYFERDEMVVIVGQHFSVMGSIKESDAFIEIVEILNTHVDQKSVFLQRVVESFRIFGTNDNSFLVNEMVLEIRDELIKMSNTLDHRQMKKILNSTHLSEFSPSMQEIKKDIEEQSDSFLPH